MLHGAGTVQCGTYLENIIQESSDQDKDKHQVCNNDYSMQRLGKSTLTKVIHQFFFSFIIQFLSILLYY